MKSYTEHLWFNTSKRIEFINITDKVGQLKNFILCQKGGRELLVGPKPDPQINGSRVGQREAAGSVMGNAQAYLLKNNFVIKAYARRSL